MREEKELMKEQEQQEEARRLAHLRASQKIQDRASRPCSGELTPRRFLVLICFFKQGYRFKNCKQSHRRERINRKGRHIDLEGLRKLVDKNLSRRILYSRWMLFKAVHDSVVQLKEVAFLIQGYTCADKFSFMLQFLDANISYWLRKYKRSQQSIERLVLLREHYFQLHREQQELVRRLT